MTTKTTNNWHEANQQYLMAALVVVHEGLERYKESMEEGGSEKETINSEDSIAFKKLKQAAERLPAPAALDTLSTVLGLSSFERDILLMCAGVELDAKFSKLYAELQGNITQAYPTFSMALSTISGAHWSAISPDSPLRYWRLIEVKGSGLLTKSPIRIDECVLHYLTGVSHMEERLKDIVDPVFPEEELVPSHHMVADSLTQAWLERPEEAVFPIIQLCGNEVYGKRVIAAYACSLLGLDLYSLSAYDIPGNSREVNELVHLWERHTALNRCTLFLDCNEIDTTDVVRYNMVTRLCERVGGTIIVSSRKRGLSLHRPMVIFDIKKPTVEEQRSLWETALGDKSDNFNGNLDTILSQFNMSTQTIRSATTEISGNLLESEVEGQDTAENVGSKLWDACRAQTRPRLDELAQHIEPAATWDDIVLPSQQIKTLREIAIHVRMRAKVYGEWGFDTKGARGLGISALFTGESGTGKTMASEVLANDLRLDLYRIDLSQVVNKYIGETEKNLKRIFDAAEEGGAILLFDEADALFGKRSEVTDSHDRYANIEVSYLLQRMELYRGLAILTTNMKNALDKAFMRRIRFVVSFPFPDTTQRAEIWRRIFPSDTPTKDIEMHKLAKLNVPGGNIRNIALNAAFLAAEDGGSVRMEHLSQAARSEYTKLEKPLTEKETKGWV